MSKSEIIFAGVDDGHNNTCIATSTGQEFHIPSRAAIGSVKKFSIAGQKQKTFAYQSGDDIFTLGDVDKTAPTNFNEYPVSTMNRAIVNHALHLAGLGGKNVIITTGLPVRHYYKYSGTNDELIKKKKRNLLSSSEGGNISSLDGLELARIVKHHVVAEGIAAWIDFVTNVSPDGDIQYDMDLIKERIAIVDIGGRTTDVAVIKDWDVDPDRSATIDAGMLSVHEVIRGMVKEEFDAEVDDEQVYKAVESNQIKVFGKNEDVTRIVDTAKSEVLGQIYNEIKRRVGSGGDLSNILFVGGGSQVFAGKLSGWYERNGIISPNPLYANAIGMAKCSMLMLG